MRMMLKAVVGTEAGNETIRNGTMAKLIEQTMQELRPEAAYSVGSDDGHRSCVIVFDLDDPSRIPAVSEPFFQGGGRERDPPPVHEPRRPAAGSQSAAGLGDTTTGRATQI
jgi:hypothetical protein